MKTSGVNKGTPLYLYKYLNSKNGLHALNSSRPRPPTHIQSCHVAARSNQRSAC